jgi:CHAD domain-containing protein
MGLVPLGLLSRLRQRQERGLQELLALLSTLGPHSQPELIHEIRVLTRRQRVLCRLLQSKESPSEFKKLERRLRKMTKALSSVRSWDVSVRQLKGFERQWREGEKRGLGFLRRIFKEQTQRVRRRDLPNFPKKKLTRFLDPARMNPSWDHFSGSQLERRIRDEICGFADRALEHWTTFQRSGTPTDLHRVRILLKKLRYLLEIQTIVMDAPHEAGIDRLKSLQDKLGDIHDLHVLRGHLQEAVVEKRISLKQRKRYRRIKKSLKSLEAQAVKDFQESEGDQLSPWLEEMRS